MQKAHPAQRPRSRQRGPEKSRGCNTRFQNSFCSDSGVDTVSYALRPRASADLSALAALRPGREVLNRDTGEYLRLKSGPAGSVLVADEVGAMRLGIFPGPGLVFAEGRLAAILSGTTADHALAPSEELTNGATKALEALAHIGLEFEPEPVGVRRLDLAAELRFDRPADGLCFLRAMAALEVPGLKRDVWVNRARVETVYWRTPKKGAVRGRLYCKGTEAQTDRPGARLRLERQVRYPKSQQQTPETVSSGDLEALYRGRMEALTRGHNDVVAAGLSGAQSALLDRVAEGYVTPRRAERMIGTLALLERFGPDWWDKRYTAQRRMRELQELGVVLDLEREDRETVPVGELLNELVSSFKAA